MYVQASVPVLLLVCMISNYQVPSVYVCVYVCADISNCPVTSMHMCVCVHISNYPVTSMHMCVCFCLCVCVCADISTCPVTSMHDQ